MFEYVNRFGNPSGTEMPAPAKSASGMKTFWAKDAVGLFPPP